jgi:hypothetical protein
MELDHAKVDDAVLALLVLGLHDECRVWKGFDWGAMDRLHEARSITDARTPCQVGDPHPRGAGPRPAAARRVVREADLTGGPESGAGPGSVRHIGWYTHG